jgi:hypothetical protein
MSFARSGWRHWRGTETDRRRSIVHTSLYLPEPVYEARKIAFEERLKIHDVVLGGLISLCGGVGMRRLRASWCVRVEPDCQKSDSTAALLGWPVLRESTA